MQLRAAEQRTAVTATGIDPDWLRDESAHDACAIEWWFVQGYYEGAQTGRRYFMTSAFRHRYEPKDGAHPYGYSLLRSVLDPAQRKQHAASRIDSVCVEILLQAGREIRQGNLDRRLIETYRNEVREYGPPAQFVVDDTPVCLRSGPFGLAWSDFALMQNPEGFAFAFAEPETGRRCDVTLAPVRPHLHFDGIDRGTDLTYTTYPSMCLEGEVDGEPVRGEAWLDHQWGSTGAWVAADQERMNFTGWDWFGINVDDGSELLVMIYRDVQGEHDLHRSVTIRRSDGEATTFRNFLTEPLRFWRSDATQVRYPVEWRITIPELHAELEFKPLIDDQESLIFGLARSIWEGAGNVTGTLDGRPVTGRARLELGGYGYIFDVQSHFGVFSTQIDEYVEAYFPVRVGDADIQRFLGPPHWKHDASAYNETIARPVWDLMSRRGKQWRGMLNLFLLQALDLPYKPYLDLGATISELCHTGSLIIDDIEDNSRTRRGDACIHLRHGLDVAINAANTIYFLPFLLLADHPGLDVGQRVESYKLICKAFVRAHFGQALDIHWSRSMSRKHLASWGDESFGDKILQMYSDKTAGFVEAAAELACIVARTDDATRAACATFASTMGVAFQITDDILNFSISPHWGKTSGEDLREGKTTYLIYRAFRALAPAERKEIEKILCTKRLRNHPATLQVGVELIRHSGMLEACRSEAKAMVDAAWVPLSRHLKPSEPKTMLRLLCASLLDIAYES